MVPVVECGEGWVDWAMGEAVQALFLEVEEVETVDNEYRVNIIISKPAHFT